MTDNVISDRQSCDHMMLAMTLSRYALVLYRVIAQQDVKYPKCLLAIAQSTCSRWLGCLLPTYQYKKPISSSSTTQDCSFCLTSRTFFCTTHNFSLLPASLPHSETQPSTAPPAAPVKFAPCKLGKLILVWIATSTSWIADGELNSTGGASSIAIMLLAAKRIGSSTGMSPI